MAVGTGAISVQEVCDEMIGTQSSLQDCVDDYVAGSMNDTYWTSKPSDPVSLAEFRGYTAQTLVISPTTHLATTGGGNFTITITTSGNPSWTVSESLSWVSVVPTSGSGNGSVTVTVQSNSTGSTRFGAVTIVWSGSNRTCSITQPSS